MRKHSFQITPELKRALDFNKSYFSQNQEILKNLTKIANPFQDLNEQLKKFELPYKKMLEDAQKISAPLTNVFKEFDTLNYSSLFKSFEPSQGLKEAFATFQSNSFSSYITNNSSEIFESINLWIEKSEMVAVQIEQEGIFLIPYFSAASNIHSIHEELLQNKSMIQIYDEYFSEEGNLIEMSETWNNNAFFRERFEIIQKCIKAHINGDHELSIPILLIHIEKYCKSIVGYDQSTSYSDWKNKFKDQFITPSKPEEGQRKIERILSDWIALEFIITQIFAHYKEYEKIATPQFPNRHNIIHGDDIGYYKARHASLKCFLLLDVLANLGAVNNN